jgi:hypothetical protein
MISGVSHPRSLWSSINIAGSLIVAVCVFIGWVCWWLRVDAVDVGFCVCERGRNLDGRVVLRRLVFVVDAVFAARDLGIAQVSVAALDDEMPAIRSDRLAAGAFADDFCCVFGFHYALTIRKRLAYASEKITFFENFFAPC